MSDYTKARNLSWQTLIDFNICNLPVDLNPIFYRLKIPVLSYTKSHHFISARNLTHLANNDGFSVCLNKKVIVFYNDRIRPQGRIRFTLAHELGHILLGHLTAAKPVTRRNLGDMENGDPWETAANIFASRLLAPAIVLHRLEITRAEDISNLCGLSMQAARIRAKRMAALEARSAWLRSPMERQVDSQFDKFCREYR